MVNLTRIADYMASELQKMGMILMSQINGRGLPLVAFRLPPNSNRVYDEFTLSHQLRECSWIVPPYTMAPHSNRLKLMRIVVREDFGMNLCDSLLKEFKLALQTINTMDQTMIANYKARMRSQRAHPQHQLRIHTHYQNETHSLQGKAGKTHGVC